MTFLRCTAANGTVVTTIAMMLLASVGRADTETKTAAGSSSEVHWLVDMDEAKSKAAASGKPMLVLFTGSDWCPTCMRLDKEIIDHVEFAEYVNDAFVCVKIDVVSDMLDGKIPNPYEAVVKEYQVAGYPAVLILDSQGEVVARKGGQDGGPVPYVEMLKGVVEGIGKSGGEFEWLVDMDQAKEKALSTGKPLLVSFSGSDWCGWCIKLEEEVFSREAFKSFAKDAFICVKIDIVSDMLSGTIPNPYEPVLKEYQVQGYPTVLIMDPRGTVVANKGYQEGGPEPYVAMLASVLQDANIEAAAVEVELGPFARTQERVFEATQTRNGGGEVTLEMAVFLADWPLVKQLLAELPEEEKIEAFSAITNGMKEAVNHHATDEGLFSLDDVFTLANCADTLTQQHIQTLGDILSVLADRDDYDGEVREEYLSSNTGHFGKRDAAQRDKSYQLFRAAGWAAVADQYLLGVEEAFKSKDIKSLENRVAGLFEQVAVKHDDDKLKQALDITVRMREEFSDSAAAGEKGFLDIIDGLFAMNLESADQWMRDFFLNNKKTSTDFYMHIGGEAIAKTKNVSPEATGWLWLHERVASQFLAHNRQVTPTQKEVLNSLAASWLQVAPKKTDNTPAPWKSGQPYIGDVRKKMEAWRAQKAAEAALARKLLPILSKVAFYAPQGEWLRMIRPELAGNVMAARTRIFIQFGEPEKAVANVVDHASLNNDEAFEQAKNLLYSWMKAMGHDDGEPLTAAMQLRSKELLFHTLGTFQDLFARPLDRRLVLDTFTSMHVKDELFQREDVTRFLERIDDPNGQVVSDLAADMAMRLRNQWGGFNAAKPNRAYQDLFVSVDEGYELFDELLEKSSEQHPDNWKLAACLGGLRLNAAAFHLARPGDIHLESRERVLNEYKVKRDAALVALQAATKKYAIAVSRQEAGADNIGLVVMRFEAAMSIPEIAAAIVLADARDKELADLRQDILRLEGRAAEDRMIRFAEWFTSSLGKRDMTQKYAYLASAVKVQVGDQPSDMDSRTALEKKLYAYDEWLNEIRLVATLDGDKSVGTGQDFGIFVTIRHSTQVGETSDFDNHLVNKELLDLFTRRIKNAVSDDFHFGGVVFHEPDVKEYSTEETNEATEGEADLAIEKVTPFAYVVLSAKNPDVRQVPPIEIILPYPTEKQEAAVAGNSHLPSTTIAARLAAKGKEQEPAASNQEQFGNLNAYLPSILGANDVSEGIKDRQGKAYKLAMPVLSNPLDIDAKSPGAKRPCRDIVVAQTFDERLVDKGRIRLNVTAEGIGLIPDLEELLNIEQDISGYEIKDIDGQGTTLVSLKTNDRLSASCSRMWFVELAIDGRNRDLARTFTFPAAKDSNISELTNMRYNYGKLETCKTSTIDVGWIPINIYSFVMAAIGVLLAIVLLRLAYPYVKTYVTQSTSKHKYVMPDPVTPFTVATLVGQIGADAHIRLNDQQRRELRQDAAAIEQSYFQERNGEGQDLNLKAIATRWISTGRAMAGKN